MAPMAATKRSNILLQSRNATGIRNISNERIEKEQEIAQSQEQSEPARETARSVKRNRRANLRDQQLNNCRRTRRNLSSTDLNRYFNLYY